MTTMTVTGHSTNYKRTQCDTVQNTTRVKYYSIKPTSTIICNIKE